jgi:hypothetical protein
VAATFEDVRRISLALPEAEERITWETDTTFRVRDKIFAITGEGASHVSIKSTPLVQEDLIDRDPATFKRAAYVGRFGWVEVNLDRVELGELEALLRAAWRLTAPKKLAAKVDGWTPLAEPTSGGLPAAAWLIEKGPDGP